jgi:hypothetical protein
MTSRRCSERTYGETAPSAVPSEAETGSLPGVPSEQSGTSTAGETNGARPDADVCYPTTAGGGGGTEPPLSRTVGLAACEEHFSQGPAKRAEKGGLR